MTPEHCALPQVLQKASPHGVKRARGLVAMGVVSGDECWRLPRPIVPIVKAAKPSLYRRSTTDVGSAWAAW